MPDRMFVLQTHTSNASYFLHPFYCLVNKRMNRLNMNIKIFINFKKSLAGKIGNIKFIVEN